MTSEKAISVSDQLLASTEYAYKTGNFEAYSASFLLPHSVSTFEGRIEIRTRDELLRVFNAVLRHHHSRGVISLRRKTIEAEFAAPDKILATFLSQQVLRGHQLSDEVVAHAVVRLAPAGWKLAESHYASRDQTLSELLLSALN